MNADNMLVGAEFKPVLTITHDDSLIFNDRTDRRMMIKKHLDYYRVYNEKFDTENRPYWDQICIVSNVANPITSTLFEVITMIYKLKNREAENLFNSKENA